MIRQVIDPFDPTERTLVMQSTWLFRWKRMPELNCFVFSSLDEWTMGGHDHLALKQRQVLPDSAGQIAGTNQLSCGGGIQQKDVDLRVIRPHPVDQRGNVAAGKGTP